MGNYAGFRIEASNNRDAKLSITSIGDFNGDGIDDIAVGRPDDRQDFTSAPDSYGYSYSSNFSAGAVYVLFGKAEGVADVSIDLDNLSPQDGFVIKPEAALVDRDYSNFNGFYASSADFGISVVGLGDVNGDGIDDFGIAQAATDRTYVGGGYYGYYGYYGGDGGYYGGVDVSEKGVAYVIYGGQTISSDVVSVETLDGFRIDVEGVIDNLVALGDVNGDGINDIGVNATDIDAGGSTTVTIEVQATRSEYYYDIDTMTGSYADVVVTNSQDVTMNIGETKGYVIFGTSATRVSDTPVVNSPVGSFGAPSAATIVVNAEQLDGSDGFSVVTGAVANRANPFYYYEGVSVSSFAVSAASVYDSNYYFNPGRVLQNDFFSFDEGGQLIAAGDINGDGIADIVVRGSAYSSFNTYNPTISLDETVVNTIGVYDSFSNYSGSATAIIYGQTAATAAALDVNAPTGDFDYLISVLGFRNQTEAASLGDVSGNDDKAEFGVQGYLNSFGDRATAQFGSDTVYGLFVINGTSDAPLSPNGANPLDRKFVAQDFLDGQGAFYYTGGTVTEADTSYGLLFVGGLADVGDMNGDGLDDFVVVGYRYTDATPSDEGRSAFLVLGTETARTGAIDLDALVSSGLAYEFRSQANNFNILFQDGMVTSAGDFNDDGFNDVAFIRSTENGYYYFRNEVAPGLIIYGGTASLEALDGADGTNDNVAFIENVDVDITTGLRPIELSLTGTSIFGTSTNEGTGANTTVNLTVTRTGDLNATVTVDYALNVQSGDVTAADFAGGVLPSGTVTFAAGSNTATIAIEIVGDSEIETTERFSIDLSNPATDNGAPISIVDATENIRVFNDDFPVNFNAFATNATEGQPGDNSVLTYVVNRFGNTSVEATVDYSIAGSARFGASLAADSNDIDGGLPLTGTLTFAPGVTRLTIDVPISEDRDIENNEYLGLTLTNAQAGGLPTSVPFGAVTGTIINDDFNPRLSILVNGSAFGASVFEGNSGLTPVTITFLREGSTDGTLDLTYDLTQGGFAGTFRAADSNDIEGFLPSFGNAVHFEDGQSSVDVVVNINGDGIIEANEFFTVELKSFTSSAGVDYELFRPTSQIQIRNDDGRPPVPQLPFDVNGDGVIDDDEFITVEADVFGDPHITTLDGLGYSFQAVGEYILVERTDASGIHNPFSVQVRFEPVEGSDLVSITTRMAVTVGGKVIEIDAKTGKALIDGVEATELQLLTGSEGIFVNDDGSWSIILNAATGEQLMVGNFNGALNVCVFLANTDNIQGLMGNANGDLSDDFALRDGSTVPASETTVDVDGIPSLSFDFLYGRGIWEDAGYAQSWQVGSAERVFSDAEPTLPANFPLASFSLDDLPTDVVDAAIQAALDSGLDPADNQTIFDNAVLDFALTGDEAFLKSAQMLVAQPEAASAPTGAPTLPTTVGVSAAATTVTEGDSGTTPVTYTFYRLGDVTGATLVAYAVTGTANADDLEAGTALTGTVSFAAGESTKVVTLNVAGDMLSEANETLTLRITSADGGALIGAVTATTTIVTDDFIPDAADDAFSTNEDTGVSGNLFSANDVTQDSDADGDTLTVVAVNGAALGASSITLASGATLSVDGNGTFSYDPTAAFNGLAAGEIGTDSFTYTISDGNGGTDTATASFTIQGVNDDPVAEDDAFDTDFGTALTISQSDLTGNDSDPDGDDLSATIESGPANGDVEINFETGEIVYTPNAGFSGEDSFDVRISDGKGGFDISTVTITVQPDPNLPPVAVNDEYGVHAGTTLTLGALDGLLSNDFDPDQGNMLSVVASGTALNGTLDVNGDGSFTYAPNAGFVGVELVTYTISDGSATATATLTINVTNEGPTADADAFTFAANAGVQVLNVLEGDTDPEGDTLTVVDVTQPASGSVSLDSGVVSFNPGDAFATLPVGESAEVTFDYTITDGIEESTATVTITIEGTFVVVDPVNVVAGTAGRDNLIGSAGDDLFLLGGGNGDIARGLGGADVFDFSDNLLNGVRDNTRIVDWSDDDMLAGISLNDVHMETVRSSATALRFAYGEDNDIVTITGDVANGLGDIFDMTA